MKLFRLAFVVALSFSASTQASWTAVTGHITQIEATGVPNANVAIVTLDTGLSSPNCPAGTWWVYATGATTDQVKAAYAGLLAAMLSGRTVTLGTDTTFGTCQFNQIYFNPL